MCLPAAPCRPVLLGLFLLFLCGADCCARPLPAGILPLDRPFLSGYGTWDKKAHIDNGVVFLNAPGLSPKGGAGVNFPPIDLSADADGCPALRVSVGPRSTLKMLKLLLQDSDGHTGTLSFTLPALARGFVVVTPDGGASLRKPADVGKTGQPNPGRIMQWQLMGDWGGDGPVDVRVAAITEIAPAAIAHARADVAQKDAAAQARRDRLAARARYGQVGPQSPVVQAVYAAAPDVLALVIHSGTITPAHLRPYAPQPGDTRKNNGPDTILVRGGQEVGNLIGPKRGRPGHLRELHRRPAAAPRGRRPGQLRRALPG